MTKNTFDAKKSVLIRIDGNWYDCKYWVAAHPGGAESIERWHLQDATDAFYSLHSMDAREKLAGMKIVADEDLPAAALALPESGSVEKSFRKLRVQLEKDGWFERNWLVDILNVGHIYAMAILGTYLAWSHPWWALLLLGLAQQQAGWTAHDYIHGRGKGSLILGYALAFLPSFSRGWWERKHNTHHVLTNSLLYDDDLKNDKILHLWLPRESEDVWFRRFQHVYYNFVFSFLYVSWRIQSWQFALATNNYLELFLMSANSAWMLMLPWKVALGSILLSGYGVAIIVTVTHQSEELLEEVSFAFVQDQFRTTRDVQTHNPIDEYLWGGMQYQLEHHLFPTIPRYYYPSLRPIVQKWAKENGIEYRMDTSWQIQMRNYETYKRYAAALDKVDNLPTPSPHTAREKYEKLQAGKAE